MSSHMFAMIHAHIIPCISRHASMTFMHMHTFMTSYIHTGVLFSAGEKVVEVPLLESMDAARLLLRRAPRPVQPHELGVKTYPVSGM